MGFLGAAPSGVCQNSGEFAGSIHRKALSNPMGYWPPAGWGGVSAMPPGLA